MNWNNPHQCPVDKCEAQFGASKQYSAHTELLLHMKHVHKLFGQLCTSKCEYVPSMSKNTVNYAGKYIRSIVEKKDA